MLLPIWNPGLCVGHADLDQLVGTGRQLERLAEAPDNAVVRSIFRATVNEVLELAAQNVATEEPVLAANGCPRLAAHRDRHAELFRTLQGLLHPTSPHRLDCAEMARAVAEPIVAEHFEGDLACQLHLTERAAAPVAA